MKTWVVANYFGKNVLMRASHIADKRKDNPRLEIKVVREFDTFKQANDWMQGQRP